MNNEYEVRYIETFYKDLAKISKYISIQLKNNIAAHNLITDIEKAINKRKVNPSGYEKFDSARKRKETYYKIYVKNYIIFYVIKENVIEIRRLIYKKRNLEKII